MCIKLKHESKFVNGILRNWESLCDIRPDCHHHFDASGTSNAMFDELAERSLMGPLAETKHTYVRLAIIVYCQILALFFQKKNNSNNNYYKIKEKSEANFGLWGRS